VAIGVCTKVRPGCYDHGMTPGFVWRVCIVGLVALTCFAYTHRPSTHTVTRTVVINRNEEAPDGKITRAECARLKGKTLQEVVYQYGLPQDFDPTDSYWDTLFYPLRNANGEQNCSVGIDVYGKDRRVERVSIDV